MPSTPIAQIAATLRHHELWGTLGWADIKFRYRRTVIGPFWLTISTGIMVFAIGLLYSALLQKDISAYIPFLAIGMIIWLFINASMTEGCSVFINAAGIIKAYPIALPTHVFRLMWRNVIIFVHNVVIIVVVWAIFRWPLSPVTLLVVPGLALLMIFVFGLTMFFGVLCTRFRDVPLIIGATMQLLFFLTPVMWAPGDVGAQRWIVEINPLYGLIEVVRSPLLNTIPPLREWLMAAGSAAFSLWIGLVFYVRHHHRIPYWL